jgi:hypothetical protein
MRFFSATTSSLYTSRYSSFSDNIKVNEMAIDAEQKGNENGIQWWANNLKAHGVAVKYKYKKIFRRLITFNKIAKIFFILLFFAIAIALIFNLNNN